MKTNDFSHLNYSDMEHEFRKIAAACPDIFDLQKTDILMDQDICDYLKISVRTLRKFCRQNKIHYVRLGGRYYYIRQIFVMNLMKICND
jgi:excisionase family DNA binding protein